MLTDCSRQHPVVDLNWSLRDQANNLIARDHSQGLCCSYSDGEVYTNIGYFVAHRTAQASLVLRFNRSAEAIRQLDPRIEVDANWEVSKGFGINELLVTVLIATSAIAGLVMTFVDRRSRSDGREQPASS